MNPYNVLMVKPGSFTLEELRENYRKLASQLHPGRCRLSKKDADDVLAMLTSCYKSLMNDYNARAAETHGAVSPDARGTESASVRVPNVSGMLGRGGAGHSSSPTSSSSSSLASASRSVHAARRHGSPSVVGTSSMELAGARGRGAVPVSTVPENAARDMAQKFDMAKFNKVFEDHRTPSVYDKGYLDWLNGEQADKEDGDSAPKACDVEQIHDPEPVSFVRCKNMTFTELGVDDVDNFGRTDYGPRNAIKYSDLRAAYSARNNMINARLLAEYREQNKTLDQLKIERSRKEALELTPQQEAALAEKRRMELMREKAREITLSRQDQTSAQQFNVAHARMFTPR